jgi:nitroimidazol reductase NimA-like FMN-containing flavoprotein (pyridoxamine 5'-phosphate oxidase superfamily)
LVGPAVQDWTFSVALKRGIGKAKAVPRTAMNEIVPSARARLKRLAKRGAYDRATVHAVLDASVVCHIAYVLDGQPYCTPTAYWREGDRLYWHGSSVSRMLQGQGTGLPVCLTATHIDGLVLARSGFNCSMNYRAVMVFGTASKVEDEAHKREALDAYVERLFPGRVAEMRRPTDKEVRATSLISMEIEEASVKIRSGPPHDDEDDLAAGIWAGVIPIAETIGALRPCPLLPAGIAPGAGTDPYAPGRSFDEILRANVGGGVAPAEAGE